jgi:hypothetical protein
MSLLPVQVKPGSSKTPTLEDHEREIISMLSSSGALRNDDAARRLVSYLGRATNLGKAKELIIVVLRKTVTNSTALYQFVRLGGMKYLSAWLREAVSAFADNESLIKETLRVLDVLPIDVDALVSSEIGKPVARFSNSRGGMKKYPKGGPLLVRNSSPHTSACAPPARPLVFSLYRFVT